MDKNAKTALIIGGIVLAVVVIVPSVLGAVFGWQGDSWGMMGSGMSIVGMMGGLMFLFWIAIPLLVICGIIALVRGGGSGSSANQSDSALEILKKRYARGEIDKAEYEERRKDLV